jgi:hypothetical protein
MNKNMKIACITQLTENGVKQTTTDVLGELTQRFVNVRDEALDKAIQQKLVEMGWRPPGAIQIDRTAAAKAGAKALKREAAWVAADLSDSDAKRCVEAVLDAILPLTNITI